MMASIAKYGNTKAVSLKVNIFHVRSPNNREIRLILWQNLAKPKVTTQNPIVMYFVVDSNPRYCSDNSLGKYSISSPSVC